jgi:hypothetical protein
VFAQLKRLEERVAQEEKMIAAERNFNARLVDEMSPAQRQQHDALADALQRITAVCHCHELGKKRGVGGQSNFGW